MLFYLREKLSVPHMFEIATYLFFNVINVVFEAYIIRIHSFLSPQRCNPNEDEHLSTNMMVYKMKL